jgi:hypothetical protein
MQSYPKDQDGIDLVFYKNDFEIWGNEEERQYNNNLRQKQKYIFFQQAYDYLSANFIQGDYYEFGCHKGRTFRMSLSEARKKNFNSMKFYAFDSFEGLPEPKGIDRSSAFFKGGLATSLDQFKEIMFLHNVYVDKIKQIKGFFENTLTKELQKEFIKIGSKISLVYIDCDLYESTVPVLNFIKPLLQEGSIVCFDDWNLFKGNPNKGEKKAFKEFQINSNLKFEEFISVGWFAKSFITIVDE